MEFVIFIILIAIAVVTTSLAFYFKNFPLIIIAAATFLILGMTLFFSTVEINKIQSTNTITIEDYNSTTINQDYNYVQLNVDNDDGMKLIGWGSFIAFIIIILYPFLQSKFGG